MSPELENFQKNLKTFYQTHSKDLFDFGALDLTDLTFCVTDLDELNLQKNENGKKKYFHAQSGALPEAKHLLQNGELLQGRVVFIYGLGLGYYYDAIEDWLHKDPNRILVFLEDDLRVIYRFFETKRAAKILSDPQVLLKPFKRPSELEWGNFRAEFDWIFWAFACIPYDLLSLKLYMDEQQEFVDQLYGQIAMNLSDRAQFLLFHLERIPQLEMHYFYENILCIEGSYNGHDLVDELEGLPAIICGAGPSLSKQIGLLKELENRALIFAAGSSLNVLNAHGIEPHFGGGIDPLPAQFSRTLTHMAFMIPLLYMDCYSHEAFLIHNGPKIHLNWKFFYPFSNWFMKKLGIAVKNDIESGNSTSEFCLHAAYSLGCNPLIFAGLDLAFSSLSRYPSGVRPHPLDEIQEKERLKDISAGNISLKGIGGKDVLTQWLWIKEGGGYSQFALNHRDREFVNSTEEGIILAEIPHISLKEIAAEKLTVSYDLDNFIHAAIQSGSMPQMTFSKAEEVLRQWRTSLENCRKCYEKSLDQQQIKPNDLLSQEPAFEFFIGPLGEVYEYTTYLERHFFHDENEILKKKHLFIINLIDRHLQYIDASLKALHSSISHASMPQEEVVLSEFSSSTAPIQKQRFYYKGGALKGESGYLNGVLEGDSIFYSPEGKVIGRSVFIQGKKEGISVQYYLNGNICSLQKFSQGKREGMQQYFYPNGSLQAKIPYEQGVLNGTALFYYSNGIKKREISFSNGALDGLEKIWHPNGSPWMEIKYALNQPIDHARQWHPNGLLAKEVVYYGSEASDYYEWDQNGMQIKKQLHGSPNIFQEYAQKSELLKKQMEELLGYIQKMKDDKP